MRKILYQTVDDRGNPEEVERQGPFMCGRYNAWLGTGYYFWDTFIELAHWWGHNGYHDNYMICEASCDVNDKIFDLVGNTDHIQILDKYSKLLKEKKPEQTITVAFVIMHMCKYLQKEFPYKAIRACGINTINKGKLIEENRLCFKSNCRAYLDLKPAIQICIINKKEMGFTGYKIIYPNIYVQNQTI
jgi:hypothetical protein